MDELTYGIIKSEKEREEITKLITEVYIEKGYLESSHSKESQVGTYLSLPTATTFCARVKGKAVGTLSVIDDGDRGLPMDVIFKDELDHKRGEGKSIAEVCQFAIDKNKLREILAGASYSTADIAVSTGLIGLALHFGIHKKYDFLCLAINPKHRIFYESVGCVQIGEQKEYPSVNNAPALAYLLDMNMVKNEKDNGSRQWMLKEIFKNPPDYNLFKDVV